MSLIYYTEKEMNKFAVIQKFINKSLSLKHTMQLLSCSERTVYRYANKVKNKWAPWIVHWLRWKSSNNKTSTLEDYKQFAFKHKYRWFWPTLLAEALEEELQRGKINPESLRIKMIQWGLRVPKRRNTKVKRELRERRVIHWSLSQFDWSYHDWLENWEEHCLLVAIDDATSDIKHWLFCKWESLLDITTFWKDYFLKYWKPDAIYLDRHATYKVNHWGDYFDNESLTRFQRWMKKLWVDVIYANTPEWKWRVERFFRTAQDRLIKKMRLKWIKSISEAQDYLVNTYIPEHNKKFSIEPKMKWDNHTKLSNIELERFEWLFAKESERTIKRDWTIKYNNKLYQISKWQTLYNNRKLTILENFNTDIEIYSWKSKLDFKEIDSKYKQQLYLYSKS